MSFLQNCEVCFNQERLPITDRNFRHKSLVRPKSKFPNWQGSLPISFKAKLLQRNNIYLVDQKCNITCQNSQEKLRSDQFLHYEMPKIAEKLPYNLYGWPFYKVAKFALTKKGYQ